MPEVSINRKFVLYLMASYLYYEEDISLLTDTQFDELCKELLVHWDDITHYHKHLTTREDLEAGTGFAIKYPMLVVCAARKWYRDHDVVPSRKKK